MPVHCDTEEPAESDGKWPGVKKKMSRCSASTVYVGPNVDVCSSLGGLWLWVCLCLQRSGPAGAGQL